MVLSSQAVDIVRSVSQFVRDAKELIANELDRDSNRSDQAYYTGKVSSGERGRPRYDVQEAQLQVSPSLKWQKCWQSVKPLETEGYATMEFHFLQSFARCPTLN